MTSVVTQEPWREGQLLSSDEDTAAQRGSGLPKITQLTALTDITRPARPVGSAALNQCPVTCLHADLLQAPSYALLGEQRVSQRRP